MVEGHSGGGLVGFFRKFAGGGFIPGFGGGDTEYIKAEKGEYVVKKEAVRKYGLGFLEMLNNLRLQLPRIAGAGISMPKTAYASGGVVSGSAQTIKIDLGLGGKRFQVMSDKETANKLVSHLKRMKLVGQND